MAASSCDRNSRRRRVTADDIRKSNVDVGRVTLGSVVVGVASCCDCDGCIAWPFGCGPCCREMVPGTGDTVDLGVESRLVVVCSGSGASLRVSCFTTSAVSDPLRGGEGDPFVFDSREPF